MVEAPDAASVSTSSSNSNVTGAFTGFTTDDNMKAGIQQGYELYAVREVRSAWLSLSCYLVTPIFNLMFELIKKCSYNMEDCVPC